MTTGTDTKRIILETATRLMGRHGINHVSNRKVLCEAGVNLALCQYHFGGREGLIHAVLTRPARALISEWDDSLTHFETLGVETVPPQEVLGAFFGPVIRLCREDPDGANLLGQLFANPDPFFRNFSEELFGEVLPRFGHALKMEFSGRLPEKELSARIGLLTGFVFFALSRSGATILLSDIDIAEAGKRASLDEMVSFCMAGLGGGVTWDQGPTKALA